MDEGEPFATVCNLFSKIYFVTIYLSLKKGQLLPTPTKEKKTTDFQNMQPLWLCLRGEGWGTLGDTRGTEQSWGAGCGSISRQHPCPQGCGGAEAPAGGPAPGPRAARGQGGEGHGRCLTVDASGEQSSPLSAAGWLA